MATLSNDISKILVLINIDDPITQDKIFLRKLRYGTFMRSHSDFSDKNRELVRSQSDGDPVTDLKFFMELYTDRMSDFIMTCVVDDQWQRSLIFHRIEYIRPSASMLEDLKPSEIDEYTEIVHYYELKTLGHIDTKIIGTEDESDDDSEEDDEDEEEAESDAIEAAADDEATQEAEDRELERQMDAHSTLFLPSSKMHH